MGPMSTEGVAEGVTGTEGTLAKVGECGKVFEFGTPGPVTARIIDNPPVHTTGAACRFPCPM